MRDSVARFNDRLVVLALAVWGACNSPQHRASRRDQDTVIVARALDAVTLDPGAVYDSESLEIVEQVFEGLVRWQPGTTDIAPSLAVSWTVADGGLRWTFALRRNVRFHDGSLCDAQAVVASFARLRNNAAIGWRPFRDVEQIVALDDATVQFVLKRPYAPFLANLATPGASIVSPKAVTQWGLDVGRHPSGTGAFRFGRWDLGQRIVLTRNTLYWGERPYVARLIFEVISDPAQRIIELETGSADIALGMLPHERSFVQLHPNLQLYESATNNVSYLAMNTQRPPLDDLRVRRAIVAAIDQTPIIKIAFQGHAEPARGPLPPMQWPALKGAPSRYNDALARGLLKQANVDDQASGSRPLRLYIPNQPRAYLVDPERVGSMIQAALAAVGLEVEVVAQPFAQHIVSVEQGAHDLCLLGWVGDNGDPDNFLFDQFATAGTEPPHPRNFAFLRDPQLDKLLQAGQSTIAQHARVPYYQQAQQRILDLAPWAPLAHSRYVVALRSDWRGIVLTPTGHVLYSLLHRIEAP